MLHCRETKTEVQMERYIVRVEGDASPDWNVVLSEWPGITLLYVFPSGRAYIETTPDIFNSFQDSIPKLLSEIIARHDP